MTFEVEVDKDHSEIQAEEAKYGGKRFRVTCKIAAQKYGRPFGLDVGIGDPMIQVPEEITMPDRLDFIGVSRHDSTFTPSRLTSPKSFTPIPNLVTFPTPGTRTCPISR